MVKKMIAPRWVLALPLFPTYLPPSGALTSVETIDPIITDEQALSIPSAAQVEGVMDAANADDDSYSYVYAPGAELGALIESLIGAKSEAIPGEGEGTGTLTPDVSDNAAYNAIGLDDVFPFCIPFDLIDCIRLFSADAKAPRFEFPLISKKFGLNQTIVVDLAPFEPVALVLRTLEIIAFIVALILVTRNLIGS